MEFVQVKDHENLVRDPSSNGIINTNIGEYEEYLSLRETANDKNDSEVSMKQDLDSLKGEINEIKSLLKELVRGN